MPQNCLYCQNKAVLDSLMIKIADLKTNHIIFSGVFTGEDREFKTDGLKIVDSGRFDRLMKSATAQAAAAIDKTFDPQE